MLVAALLLVKRHTTAAIIRRVSDLSRSTLAAICALLCILSGCVRYENRAQTYQQIDNQIEAGDYEKARENAKRSWSESPASEWGWKFKAQYVLMSIFLNDKGTAANLLKDPVPSEFNALKPRYQYLRAYLSLRQNDPSASPQLASVVELSRQVNDPVTESEALNLLARLNTKDAVTLLTQALDIIRKNHLEFLQASTLNELGESMYNRQQFSDAVSYFQQAAPLAHKHHARFLEALIRANLGKCYLNIGDLDRAILSLEEARSQFITADPQSARSLVSIELGTVYSLRQENSKAIEYFHDAFEIVKSDPKLNNYVSAAEKLAAALIEAHRLDEGQRYNELAHDSFKNDVTPTTYEKAFYYLNQADLAAQHGSSEQAARIYTRLLQMPPDELGDLRWSADARLAELEAQSGQDSAARRDFERALSAIEENRSQQSATEHQITFLSALIRFYQQYVDFLVKHGNSQEALAVADSSRASVLTQGLNPSRKLPAFLERVRAKARESNSALLFYWLAPQRSYLWLVTPQSEDFKELPAEEAIVQDVRIYSRAIQTADEDPLTAQNPAGIRLYQTLIKPVSAHLKKGMRIVIIPDGALHSLNFETLLVMENSPHYWLSDAGITIAPSLRILLDDNNSKRGSNGALVIGDGDYSAASDKYPPLPESKKEVSNVSALFPKNMVLTQSQAVPEAYAKANPAAYSLIHFSAHVDANENSPLDSAIILSPGAYGRRELYARDLMKNPIHADLVTISGCNSVGKKVLSGEGMVGFAWAAFEAGARNAVTSLWEVDDHSTTELMNTFYTEVTQGKPYAEALRDAKLQMLKGNFKKPYYWAPFQLYSRNLSDASAPVLQAKR
jgi:CHAT domain-containing protein